MLGKRSKETSRVLHPNPAERMIYIYTPYQSPRLSYVLDFVFRQELELPYKSCDNKRYIPENAALLNYSKENIPGSLQIIPQGLLDEQGIRQQPVQCEKMNGHDYFFRTAENGALPFDIFSSIFYLLSRYEEYLPFKPDIHGRFPATASLAYRSGFIEKAVVNQWINMLQEVFSKNFPQLVFPVKKYKHIPTIDIDIAYAYKHRSFGRTAVSLFRKIFSGHWKETTRQLQVLLGKKQDDYDVYDHLLGEFRKNSLSPVFFFQVGAYGEHDKNLSPRNRHFRELIREVSTQARVGLHSSYLSFDKPALVEREKKELASVLGQEITLNRQHFLRIKLPDTYKNLIKYGISEDWSMGYADHCGFRAGTFSPFFFYDLAGEKTTNLKIIPFAFMEGTLKEYMKLTPVEAEQRIFDLVRHIKELQGCFISLWHNETLSETQEWKAWRAIYYKLLRDEDSIS